MKMTRLISQAQRYAAKQHLGQTRKGDNSPYITHPEAVYEIARLETSDPAILAACWLHDTIEDTSTTYEELRELFGKEIADIVLAVSEDKTIKDWKQRKAKYIKNVFSNEKAQIVAWADKMHNAESLIGVKDLSVFNVPIKDKLDFYSRFAKRLSNQELRTELELVLDLIYDIVYYISE